MGQNITYKFIFLLVLMVFGSDLWAEAPRWKRLDPTTQPRIISLSPGLTEIIAGLGLSSKLVGRTRFCDFPLTIKPAEVVGDIHLNVEKIVSLQPTHILIQWGFHVKETDVFDNLGLNYSVVKLENIEDILPGISFIGGSFQREQESSNMVRHFRSLLKKYLGSKNKKPTPSVFLEIQSDPLMTAGKGTLLEDVVTLAGGRNVFGGQGGYFLINPEKLMEKNPDFIIQFNPLEGRELMLVKDYPLSSFPLKAIKENKVFRLNADIATRPGPRIFSAIRILSELFSQ